MNAGNVKPLLPIYPAKYFDASPTYWQWNKLTAADVHALREERGFAGQHIYFYLNHPIIFVCVIGPIVGITDINSKIALLTIDDGSGALIDIKIDRRAPNPDDQIDNPSNTLIDNVGIISSLGTFDISLNGKHLEIGTIVKAKGTIQVYKRTRQLVLKRIQILERNTEEIIAWSALARYKQDVLNKPWKLTHKDRDEVDRRKGEEQEQSRVVAKRKGDLVMRRARWHKKKIKFEDELEKKRLVEEKEMNAGALPGSDMIPR